MKNRNFFLAAAASVLALAACNKEIDYGPAKVEVDKAEIEVTQGAGSVSVSLNATIDWAAKVDGDDADWLDISPASGGPSLEAQTLTIKYTENTEFDREASILIQGDVLHKTFVNVKQAGAKGDPSVVTQITVKEFLEKKDLDREYILEGKISGVANTSYKGFDLTDETGTIACAFPVNFDEFAGDLKNGGIVRIQGKYAFYEQKQTHQLGNGTILSYEAPMAIDPSKIETLTVKEFLEKADPTTPYRLVGTVKGFNAEYCSFDLVDSTGSIYIYSVDDESEKTFADKMANGKKVTLFGNYYWYEKGSKAEINPATIEKVEDAEGGDDSGEGSGDDGQGGASSVKGIVAAVSAQAFLVQTASGYTYVFAKADPGVKVGDEVEVNGTAGTYAGLDQINDPKTTVVSSGNSVTYPSPTVLDGAAMDKYNTGFGYVSVTGNLSKSGNYYNLDVKDASRTGSLSYPVNVPDNLIGKTVDVTGFFVGISGSIYFNILVVDIKESSKQDVATLSHPLTSDIKWTLGTNGYDATTKTKMSAKVNGTDVSDLIKLGTSSAGGDATLTIPKGVTKIGFYAAGWKTTQSEESSGTTMNTPVTVKVGGKALEVKRNKGCTGNPPFTITFSDETDYYEVEVPEDSSVKIEAPSRIVVIGINAVK